VSPAYAFVLQADIGSFVPAHERERLEQWRGGRDAAVRRCDMEAERLISSAGVQKRFQ
jgi:hypothetical protein